METSVDNLSFVLRMFQTLHKNELLKTENDIREHISKIYKKYTSCKGFVIPNQSSMHTGLSLYKDGGDVNCACYVTFAGAKVDTIEIVRIYLDNKWDSIYNLLLKYDKELTKRDIQKALNFTPIPNDLHDIVCSYCV